MSTPPLGRWAAPIPGARYDGVRVPSGILAAVTLDAAPTTRPAGRVVLVPGLTGSKEDFALVMPLLAQAGYRTESVDLAGQFGSAAAGPRGVAPRGESGSPSYDADLFAADLVALLDAGEPAHVVGYSFAGVVAQLVAAARPGLVRSLALISTPPGYGNGFRGVSWIGWASGLLGPRVAAALMLWGIRNNLNRVDADRYSFVRARLDVTRRDSVDDAMAVMMAIPDVREKIAALPVPKLVAVGAHDLWPVRRHARFAASVGAELRVYPTGHSPNETAPDALVADLVRLYAASPASGADPVA